MRPLRLAAAGARRCWPASAVSPVRRRLRRAAPVGSPAADCRARIAGLDLQTATVPQLQAAMAQRPADQPRADAGLPRAHPRRTTEPTQQRPRRCRRRPWPRPTGWTASGRPARSAGRCTASRSCSRTTSAPARVPTTAGSIALEGNVPKREAFVTAAAARRRRGRSSARRTCRSSPTGCRSACRTATPASAARSCNAYDLGDPFGSSSGSGRRGLDGLRRRRRSAPRPPARSCRPSEVNGAGRREADARAGQRCRRHPARAQLRRRRPDDPQRHRRGGRADRDRRAGPARPRRRRRRSAPTTWPACAARR